MGWVGLGWVGLGWGRRQDRTLCVCVCVCCKAAGVDRGRVCVQGGGGQAGPEVERYSRCRAPPSLTPGPHSLAMSATSPSTASDPAPQSLNSSRTAAASSMASKSRLWISRVGAWPAAIAPARACVNKLLLLLLLLLGVELGAAEPAAAAAAAAAARCCCMRPALALTGGAGAGAGVRAMRGLAWSCRSLRGCRLDFATHAYNRMHADTDIDTHTSHTHITQVIVCKYSCALSQTHTHTCMPLHAVAAHTPMCGHTCSAHAA